MSISGSIRDVERLNQKGENVLEVDHSFHSQALLGRLHSGSSASRGVSVPSYAREGTEHCRATYPGNQSYLHRRFQTVLGNQK